MLQEMMPVTPPVTEGIDNFAIPDIIAKANNGAIISKNGGSATISVDKKPRYIEVLWTYAISDQPGRLSIRDVEKNTERMYYVRRDGIYVDNAGSYITVTDTNVTFINNGSYDVYAYFFVWY